MATQRSSSIFCVHFTTMDDDSPKHKKSCNFIGQHSYLFHEESHPLRNAYCLLVSWHMANCTIMFQQ